MSASSKITAILCLSREALYLSHDNIFTKYTKKHNFVI
ncbi:Hypothetical protein BN2458_PEG1137 [Helicobacter typhlonius]|uniref:Uncharacterized protein n=1 Tax=Helicobacter typhlonius TaxID=76936 RepID=A0A0S4PWA0_9HELI|nr:Hypothetical protein BN2458_PEG1137 [Helicobacter typhlonius]